LTFYYSAKATWGRRVRVGASQVGRIEDHLAELCEAIARENHAELRTVGGGRAARRARRGEGTGGGGGAGAGRGGGEGAGGGVGDGGSNGSAVEVAPACRPDALSDRYGTRHHSWCG